jgi:hypothetical protein
VWRHRRSSSAPDAVGSLVVAALSLLSMITPLAGFATQGPGGASNLLYHLAAVEPRGLFVALAGAALLVGGTAAAPTDAARLVVAISGVLLLATGAATLDLTLISSFDARGGSTLAVIALAAFLFWQWVIDAQGASEAPTWLLGVTVVFAAGSVVLLLAASTAWARSLDAFRTEVNRGHGIAVARSVLAPDRQQVLWDWPEPSLSLIVRSTPAARILVARAPSYVPFPAERARLQMDDAYVWRG